tara:strand:- start:3052 stop:3555 length:504 start_codon:yes stop_codon:yes gene_type:complete
MKSELLLQYLGYLAIALFCGYFVYIVLKVQSDYMLDSVEGENIESFIGGSVIEGMKVTENEKKSYETGTQNIDIFLDTWEKDRKNPEKEYFESIPDDTKESILELYDEITEYQAVNLINQTAKKIKNIKNAKNVNEYIMTYDNTFMKKLNKNEDLRNKVLELLGRKR